MCVCVCEVSRQTCSSHSARIFYAAKVTLSHCCAITVIAAAITVMSEPRSCVHNALFCARSECLFRARGHKSMRCSHLDNNNNIIIIVLLSCRNENEMATRMRKPRNKQTARTCAREECVPRV